MTTLNVTLEYSCYVGLQDPAAMVAAVQAVVLDEGELAALGLGVSTDVTAAQGANVVKRTLDLQQNAFGTTIITTEQEMIDATTNLFTGKLSLRVPAKVTASVPVVT